MRFPSPYCWTVSLKFHRIIESSRFEQTRSSSPTIRLSAIILTQPCHSTQCLNVPWTLPGLVIPPLPWAAIGSPEPPLLQTKQSQLPQLLLIRPVLQTPHQLSYPFLDMLQGLGVFLAVRGPKVNTVLEVRPHQCWVQRYNYFSNPVRITISNTSQDASGLLSHLGTLVAHVQLAINQYLELCFDYTVLQSLCPKTVALPGVVVAKVQGLALGLVEHHLIGFSLAIKPTHISL